MPPWFDQEVNDLERRTYASRNSDKVVLFYGSSTFTLWHDMERHFPAYNVVNHGFGGSTMGDCLEYFDRLVPPLKPCVIILYAGDNDLDNGTSPEGVMRHVCDFVERKRKALGDVPMAYVSIKVSPARQHFMHKIAYTNRIIERALAGAEDVRFLDITRRMVARGYVAWAEHYSSDPLHMSRRGYQVFGKSLSEFLETLEKERGSIKSRIESISPAWMDDDVEPEQKSA